MFSKKTLSVLAVSVFFVSASAWAWQPNSKTPFRLDASGQKVKDETGFNQLSANVLDSGQCPQAHNDGWRCYMENFSGGYNWANFIANSANAYAHSKNTVGLRGAYHLADDYFYALARDSQARNLPESAWAYRIEKKTTDADGNETVTYTYDSSKTMGGDNIGGYTVISGYHDYNTSENSGNVAAAIMGSNLEQCGCVTSFGTGGLSSNLYNSKTNQCMVSEAQLACAESSQNSKNTIRNKDLYAHFDKLASACIHYWNNLVNQTINANNGVAQYIEDADGKWVPNDKYVEYCDPYKGGKGSNVCRVCGFECNNVSFIGPGLLSVVTKDDKGKTTTKLYNYEEQQCTENTNARIDIVAQ